MKKVLRILMIISVIFCGSSLCGSSFVACAEETQVDKDAKFLYTQVRNFLDKNKDCPPEDFDKVCADYMLEGSGPLTVLDKEAFEEQTKSDLRLYRGVSKKEFADDMKAGGIYIGGGANSFSGSGIYTTPNSEVSDFYSTLDGVGAVITLAMNKKAKIIDRSYLEEVKLKMREMYPEEFNCALGYDLLVPPTENRKMYWKDKKVAILANCGVLAKLLGYDALHTVFSAAEESGEEYLILDAGVLTVCK